MEILIVDDKNIPGLKRIRFALDQISDFSRQKKVYLIEVMAMVTDLEMRIVFIMKILEIVVYHVLSVCKNLIERIHFITPFIIIAIFAIKSSIIAKKFSNSNYIINV